jgi:hypothetical protein
MGTRIREGLKSFEDIWTVVFINIFQLPTAPTKGLRKFLSGHKANETNKNKHLDEWNILNYNKYII